jgi:hypothetical protein
VWGRFCVPTPPNHNKGEFLVNLNNDIARGFFYAADAGTGGGGESSQTEQTANDQVSAATTPKSYDEAYVAKLRDESARHRIAAKDASDKLKVIEDAGKSELQKAQEAIAERDKKLTDYEAKERNATLMATYKDVATEANARNPATVAKLLMAEGIELGTDGNPKATALTKALNALKADSPELFSKTGPSGSQAGANGGAKASDMNAYIRERARA